MKTSIASLSAPVLLLAAAFAAATDHARAVPAGLSPDEMHGLVAGKGLGQARPAELHGYPGPMHVLELADALQLGAEQRARSQALFDTMLAEARRLGAALVDSERELDRRFAGGTIDTDTLQRLTAQIGSLRGELRAVHLRAHLAQRDVLDAAQRERYAQLRGAHASQHPHAPSHDGH